MKKFFVLVMCLLIILPLWGCSPEETGVMDWIKWFLNRGSGAPVYSGNIQTGVEEPVNIYYDDYGTPHIYAEKDADLFFAQGYAHANDRLFQMDLMRRMVSGSLTEIVGGAQEGMVEDDIFHRTVGFRRAAEKNLDEISERTLDMLDAYAAGVNAYIEENKDDLPPEFVLFDYVPEDWAPVDSMVITKLIAWGLGGNMETELFLFALAGEIGEDSDKFADILPTYLEYGPKGVEGALSAKDVEGATELMELSRNAGLGDEIAGLGSNNWAISGEHTETGGALLASDMHLPMDLPSIWFKNHLVVPGELKVTGVMFPGVPGVVAGYNEHIAWAETNLGPDVMDLYKIDFHEEDPHKYRYDDDWLEAEVIKEVIEVRGEEDIELEILETKHGPVISGAVDMDTDLSLKWTGLEGTTEADALKGMMEATNFDEFREAMRNWEVPAQNFIYADVEGNIGYLGNGKFPIRSDAHEEAGNGLLPVPGWSSDYEWEGFVDMDEVPSLYNPPEGKIATANHRIVDEDYPHFLTHEWSHPSRAMSILKHLEEMDDYTLEDMKEIQSSFYNYQAKMVMPELIAALQEASEDMDSMEKEALEVLQEWGEDPVDEVDDPAPAIFWHFYSTFLHNIFADQVSEELMEKAYGYTALLQVIDQKIIEGESVWVDDIDGLIQDSFAEAIADLGEEMGGDLQDWEWGHIHTITFKHHIGEDVSARDYNRGPKPVGGSLATPANMGFTPTAEMPYEVWISAPYRYLIDLSNHEAYDSLAIGNSGHIRSEHYDDQMELWLEMDYVEMLFEREDIEALDRVLTLEPN